MSAAVLQTYPLPADPDLPPRSYGRSPIVAGMAKTFELHVFGCFPRASSSRMRALAAASSLPQRVNRGGRGLPVRQKSTACTRALASRM